MIYLEPYGYGPEPKALRIDLDGALSVWTSYGEAVAFRLAGQEATTVRRATRNAWQAKHVDEIDGGSSAALRRRVDPADFGRRLRIALAVAFAGECDE